MLQMEKECCFHPILWNPQWYRTCAFLSEHRVAASPRLAIDQWRRSFIKHSECISDYLDQLWWFGAESEQQKRRM